ncbi:YbaY family lipoprotein [uncultured Shewanella sp.]|uniref:YbaY family lipoprotein n=1 Tax=uncultured Shewanella sp. TaxID=173975 RepID=UPI0026378EE3|nr:YbaY family lipoprotein [uncultured Shewanella sp.]
MMLSLKKVFFLIVSLSLLIACVASNEDEYVEIDGIVSYRTPVTLPDTAILTVKLKNIADHTQPPIVLDELNKEKVALPTRFSFTVPLNEFVKGHMNIIQAYVKYKDKLIFMELNAVNVNLNSQEPLLIMLEKVSE